ncbi:MAG: DUF3887 domain-containing protein [Steroidobacteraceae bacterium]
MPTDVRRAIMIGLALALLTPVAAPAAGGQGTQASLVPKAVAFIRTLAKGDFEGAEADFTDQMKQEVPPAKLREIWQGVLNNLGPLQDTGDSKTEVKDGYTVVVVRGDFKSRALGIAVTFDSAQRIAGMYFVAPP